MRSFIDSLQLDNMQYPPFLIFLAGLGVVLSATTIGGDTFGILTTVVLVVVGALYFSRKEGEQFAEQWRKEAERGLWQSTDVPDLGRVEVFYSVEFSLSSATGRPVKFRRPGEKQEFTVDGLPSNTQEFLKKQSDLWATQQLEMINRPARR